MSKTRSNNHQVLEDDTDDENGASILKINGDLRTQRMIWGFLAKNPLTAHLPLQTISDGYWITVKE